MEIKLTPRITIVCCLDLLPRSFVEFKVLDIVCRQTINPIEKHIRSCMTTLALSMCVSLAMVVHNMVYICSSLAGSSSAFSRFEVNKSTQGPRIGRVRDDLLWKMAQV
jgi:hypothetical protein